MRRIRWLLLGLGSLVLRAKTRIFGMGLGWEVASGFEGVTLGLMHFACYPLLVSLTLRSSLQELGSSF